MSKIHNLPKVPSVSEYRTLRPLSRIPPEIVSQRPNESPLINFSLMTYNILAQDHIYRTAYPYCGKFILRWSFRRDRLATEIEAYDADIVCFQEMDRFNEFFEPLLKKLGYEVAYYLRNGPNSDVNCVGWKGKKFKLIESKQVSFAGTTTGMGSVPNVAQICALQSRIEPKLKLIVATTHLYWREECDNIRLVQMHSLLHETLQLRHQLGHDYLVLLAGDFNSDHESMAIESVLRSNFLLDPLAFQEMLEKSGMSPKLLRQILSDFTVHWPRFYDSHEHYGFSIPGKTTYQLPFTSFCLYKGVLDFILYTGFDQEMEQTKSLRIAPTALRLLPDRSVLESEVALPNSIFSSDHLSLMTEFTIFSRDSP